MKCGISDHENLSVRQKIGVEWLHMSKGGKDAGTERPDDQWKYL